MADQRFGPYVIHKEVGRGGMGMVYFAEDTRTGHFVALKVLPDHLSRDRKFRERFQRECASLRQLNHPGIPRFCDEGEVDGRLYFAMDYLEGASLDQSAPGGAPWETPDRVAVVLREVAGILIYAHGRRIVHRDLSPRNIILDPSGRCRLIDFGISKLLDEATISLTGEHLGTPAYMSPEHFGKSSGIDERSDLWALGVIGFFLLTGRHPFPGDSQLTLVVKLTDPSLTAPSVREVNPAVPVWLAAIVDRLLLKNPGHRFPSAGAVVEALEKKAEPAAERFDPQREYQLGDLTWFPHRQRWGFAVERGRFGRRRCVGFLHSGGERTWRVHLLPAGPGPDETGTVRITGNRVKKEAAIVIRERLKTKAYLTPPVELARARRRAQLARRGVAAVAALVLFVIGSIAGTVWYWARQAGEEVDWGAVITRGETGTGSHRRFSRDPNAIIDINAAGYRDLRKISGVGNSGALILLALRHSRGPFRSMDEVANALALITTQINRDKMLAQLAVSTNVSAPPDPEYLQLVRQVNLATAPVEELDALPGVGATTAKSIIAARDAQGSFQTLEEVRACLPGSPGGIPGSPGGSRRWLGYFHFFTLGDEALDRKFQADLAALVEEELAREIVVLPERVDLNHAPVEVLQLALGSQYCALATMMWRHQHGPFASVEEFEQQIFGLVNRPSKYSENRARLMVSPPERGVTVEPEFLEFWREPRELSSLLAAGTYLPLLYQKETAAIREAFKRDELRSDADLEQIVTGFPRGAERWELIRHYVTVVGGAAATPGPDDYYDPGPDAYDEAVPDEFADPNAGESLK